jgi:hypothetical protein
MSSKNSSRYLLVLSNCISIRELIISDKREEGLWQYGVSARDRSVKIQTASTDGCIKKQLKKATPPLN